MKRNQHWFLGITLGVVLSLLTGTGAAATLDELLKKMPAQSTQEGDQIFNEMADMGSEAVMQMCEQLLVEKPKEDLQVRYGLTGLVKHVSEKGSSAQRAMVEQALLAYLATNPEAAVSIFLIRQLLLVGTDASIPQLSAFMAQEPFVEPVTQTLTRIGSDKATATLREALGKVEGKNKISVAKALGVLKDDQAVAALQQLVPSEDVVLSVTALNALAQIGEPGSVDLFMKSLENTTGFYQVQVAQGYLDYARALLQHKQKKDAENMVRNILAAKDGGFPESVTCGALTLLVDILEKDALDEVYTRVKSDSDVLRGTALTLANRFQGEGVSKALAGMLKGQAPAIQAQILTALGARMDDAAQKALLKALDDENDVVRRAAIEVLPHFDSRKVVNTLVAQLAASKSDVEAGDIQKALLRMHEGGLVKEVTGSLDKASAYGQKAMLDILANRGNADQIKTIAEYVYNENDNVRKAAITAFGNLAEEDQIDELVKICLSLKKDHKVVRDALITAAGRILDPEKRVKDIVAGLKQAEAAQTGPLYEALATLGGEIAFNTLVSAAAGKNEAMAENALNALGSGTSLQALKALEQLLWSVQVDALREKVAVNYTKVAGKVALSDKEKADEYGCAMERARTTEQKKALLRGLGRVKCVQALEVAHAQIDFAEVAVDAAEAVVSIACPTRNYKGLEGNTVAAALARAITVLPDGRDRNEAEKHLATLVEKGQNPDAKPDKEKDFKSLFNGKNLKNYKGDTQGYVVEDGVIVCKPGGFLVTKEQYGDFIYRFEFKLIPGGNNGLGIRVSPKIGNPAYDGMELQILDNTSDKYNTLQPYQYHGSIYGVVPARRGFLKPIGEWNQEEVIAKGDQITIKLNGVTIVDANIREASKGGTMDHKEHPGLLNEKGHIVFCGHGDRIEFRNIRIKELK